MTEQNTQSGLTTFSVVWIGQLASLLGSSLTNFALGLWVYQITNSASLFALIALSAALPGILLSPLVGAIVDREDRRTILIVCDAIAGLSSVAIAILIWFDQLAVWQIYVTTFVSSICTAFRWPAYVAATTLLAPKQQLGRISGLVQLSEGIAQVIAPLLASMLILSIGISGILVIDICSFLFAMTTLLLVAIPHPAPSEDPHTHGRSLLQDAQFGWRYITMRRGFLSLLLLFALANLVMGIVQVLLTPLVLSFGDTNDLGQVLSFAGSGLLVGGILMSTWGGPKRRVQGIFGFTLVQGGALIVGCLYATPLSIAIAAFLFLCTRPIVFGSSQVLWQSKVPADLQGRVFAIRRMVAWSTTPIAYIIAGPLADQVFEPLLNPRGALADTVGVWLGVGPGYGIALLFIVLGTTLCASVLCAALYRPLRLLEQELPDAVHYR